MTNPETTVPTSIMATFTTLPIVFDVPTLPVTKDMLSRKFPSTICGA